ncbi:MAG: hypothetical protein Q4C60_00835 [Eubacteriales bacterium]|nr:hypothetical protein [Eubacteriales bacterium]
MRPKQTAALRLAKTRTQLRNQRYRTILSAEAAFVCNLLYAVYQCALGIINLSLWFLAMCAFYGILATMRFSVSLCGHRGQCLPCETSEPFAMRLSGILLGVMSVVLAAINYLSLSQNIAVKYGEIIMITIATYTFYKVIMAIIRAVKQRRNPSLLLQTIRNISYAEAAASVVTLQRSMLVSFGSMDGAQVRFMNAVTGAAACLFVLALGISMTIKSMGKDHKLWQNQN